MDTANRAKFNLLIDFRISPVSRHCSFSEIIETAIKSKSTGNYVITA